jgi:hypothetical protein
MSGENPETTVFGLAHQDRAYESLQAALASVGPIGDQEALLRASLMRCIPRNGACWPASVRGWRGMARRRRR